LQTQEPFCLPFLITGLTTGTTYWFDTLNFVQSSSTCSIEPQQVTITILELA
jgi:hypothetical protein